MGRISRSSSSISVSSGSSSSGSSSSSDSSICDGSIGSGISIPPREVNATPLSHHKLTNLYQFLKGRGFLSVQRIHDLVDFCV